MIILNWNRLTDYQWIIIRKENVHFFFLALVFWISETKNHLKKKKRNVDMYKWYEIVLWYKRKNIQFLEFYIKQTLIARRVDIICSKETYGSPFFFQKLTQISIISTNKYYLVSSHKNCKKPGAVGSQLMKKLNLNTLISRQFNKWLIFFKIIYNYRFG